jgi:rfaE bifunctional protein nucleotidyltransferase chain/domain
MACSAGGQATCGENGKVLDVDRLEACLTPRRRAGHKIVFTNGCFDLLHVGHVRYLSAARRAGDLLVVGLNSDLSVSTIKGELRPIMPQEQRAEVLAGLTCVDYVVFFDDPDPLALIERLQPDVLVKGADWQRADIIGADEVEASGGRVERISIVPGASTTAIIETILDRYGHT